MKVGIIGAGCAGLVSAKYALDNDFECDVFERTGEVGGVWNYTDHVDYDENGLPVQRVMYKGLKTNLPKEVMSYTHFAYPTLPKSYLDQPQVLEYVNTYATEFGLRSHIKFYTLVVNVEPIENNRWKLTVKNVKTNVTEVLEYDAVMVCNGHYSKLSIPDIPGKFTFKGKQIHSRAYRMPEPFANMRVLVIGAGSSGTDIATKVSEVAQRVVLSHRESTPIKLSEKIIQKPVVKKIDGNEITYSNDTTEDFDAIIYCTGYKYSFPFLSEECKITIDSNWVKYLYKHIINTEYPTMGFIGVVWLLCPFPVCDLQARFFLASLTGRFTLPSKTQMLEAIELDMQRRLGDEPVKKYAHRIGDQRTYCEDIASAGNIEPLPDVLHSIYFKARENRNPNDCYHILDDNTYTVNTC